MENMSYVALKQPIIFELDGFTVPEDQGYLLFSLVLAGFMFILVGNGIVLSVITVDKKLHRPMYVMVCNLASCDLLGATAVMILLMKQFLTGDKRIPYVSAIVQAFSIHTYGAAVHTLLSAMAYDRYVAVCEPLRYQAIMTPARLVFSCSLAWAIAILIVGVLFALNVGTPLCGTHIRDVYCNNRSILGLACRPTPINDYYGLCITWALSSCSFLLIAFSYVKILTACLKRNCDSSSRSKAVQTCATHLVIYIIYEITILILIISIRFPNVPINVKRFCTILGFVVPPTINPIIYGLVTKELRTSIAGLFKKKISPKQ